MIVGIGSVARVGKDTAAQALVRELQFVRRGFADALKAVALATNPIVIPQAGTINVDVGHNRLHNLVIREGWETAKDRLPEVRRFLQALAEAVRNNVGESTWLDVVLKDPPTKLVIPDVRYPNEAEAVKQAGGLLIKIERPGYAARGHESETALEDYDGWDTVIRNDGSVPELEQAVVNWVKARERKRAA